MQSLFDIQKVLIEQFEELAFYYRSIGNRKAI